MTTSIAVHDNLATIRLTPLFALELAIGNIHKFPGTPTGRQLAGVTGGRFTGARLSGLVLSAGIGRPCYLTAPCRSTRGSRSKPTTAPGSS